MSVASNAPWTKAASFLMLQKRHHYFGGLFHGSPTAILTSQMHTRFHTFFHAPEHHSTPFSSYQEDVFSDQLLFLWPPTYLRKLKTSELIFALLLFISKHVREIEQGPVKKDKNREVCGRVATWQLDFTIKPRHVMKQLLLGIIKCSYLSCKQPTHTNNTENVKYSRAYDGSNAYVSFCDKNTWKTSSRQAV